MSCVAARPRARPAPNACSQPAVSPRSAEYHPHTRLASKTFVAVALAVDPASHGWPMTNRQATHPALPMSSSGFVPKRQYWTLPHCELSEQSALARTRPSCPQAHSERQFASGLRCVGPYLTSMGCIAAWRSASGVLLPQHLLCLLQYIHLQGACVAHAHSTCSAFWLNFSWCAGMPRSTQEAAQ